jgi:lipoprotein-anchoring transpeptidase ErfK/SrfK
VRSYPQYKLAGESRRWPTAARLALAILLGALLVWLGWPSRPARAGSKAPPATKAARKPKSVPAPLVSLGLAKATNPTVVPPADLVSSSPDSPSQPATLPPAAELPSSTGPIYTGPRPARGVFEAQLALDRLGISPGSLDAASGSRTRNAVRAFQEKEKLKTSGELDAATRQRLLISEPIYTNYVVTSNDLSRLLPLGKTWMEKWHQPRLDYETILEFVAEKAHAHPNLIRQLNAGVDWSNVVAETNLRLPDVTRPPVPGKAAFARILLNDRVLRAFDENTNLLLHFPCSIARNVDKRPVGELRVALFVRGPNYTFDPANFPNSAEARELQTKLVLPPGPNNPVGSVWIGLDKPGYGIHGTPHPEQVGQAESLGCFRLANWNAEYFLQFVWVGMPVLIE